MIIVIFDIYLIYYNCPKKILANIVPALIMVGHFFVGPAVLNCIVGGPVIILAVMQCWPMDPMVVHFVCWQICVYVCMCVC